MTTIMANPTQRQLIWDRQLALMDYNTQMISAREEGMKAGMEAGEERGRRSQASGRQGDEKEKLSC